jgi:hypothetical protein
MDRRHSAARGVTQYAHCPLRDRKKNVTTGQRIGKMLL